MLADRAVFWHVKLMGLIQTVASKLLERFFLRVKLVPPFEPDAWQSCLFYPLSPIQITYTCVWVTDNTARILL